MFRHPWCISHKVEQEESSNSSKRTCLCKAELQNFSGIASLAHFGAEQNRGTERTGCPAVPGLG